MGRVHVIRNRVRPFVGESIQVVVSTDVDAVGWIERRRRAGTWHQFIQVCRPYVSGRPVNAALKCPDTIELPSPQCRRSEAMPLPEKRKLPDVIESQPLPDVEGGISPVQPGKRKVGAGRVSPRGAIHGSSAVV